MQILEDHLKSEYGIVFNDNGLLLEALTQRNYLNEHPEDTSRDYQRLEFLGDALMQEAVAEYLYKKHPDWHEGKLTEMRIAMVQSRSFAHFSRLVKLQIGVRLGKGEELNGARNRESLLEDIWEAFIAALYLDQGKAAVDKFLAATIFKAYEETNFFDQFIDYKSKLQEYLQRNGNVKIEYVTLTEEKLSDNLQRFTVKVTVDGKTLAHGVGRSIKDAEKMAARLALNEITKNE